MAFSKHQAEKIAQIWPSQSFSSGYFYSVMPQKHIEDFWNKTISVHLETSYTRKQYEWLWICIQKSSGSVSIYYWLCCGFLIRSCACCFLFWKCLLHSCTSLQIFAQISASHWGFLKQFTETRNCPWLPPSSSPHILLIF